MTTAPAETDDIPVFGSEADYAPGVRFPLELTVMGPRGIERIRLAGSGKPDGGAILEMSAAGRRVTASGRPDEGALAAASERIIRAMLVDDDGVPVMWRPAETDDGKWLDWRDREVLTVDEALPPFGECSSQRRFQLVIMSPEYRVDLDALVKMARWLAGKGTEPVPTRAPTPSRRGRSTSGQKSGRGRAATRST